MNQTALLVADDNPDDKLLFERAFRRLPEPPTVQFVEDGQEAIKYLEGEGPFANRKIYPFPTLLVADLKMPKVDGFELIEWVRMQSSCRNLPIAVLTSSDHPHDQLRATALGANEYFVKPNSPAELVDLIQKLVQLANQHS